MIFLFMKTTPRVKVLQLDYGKLYHFFIENLFLMNTILFLQILSNAYDISYIEVSIVFDKQDVL